MTIRRCCRSPPAATVPGSFCRSSWPVCAVCTSSRLSGGVARLSLALQLGSAPLWLLCSCEALAFRSNDQSRSGAEADVVVRVRAAVVAVRVGQASVAAVVPVAPAIHAASSLSRHAPHVAHPLDLIHPPSMRPISFSSLLYTSWRPGEIKRSSGLTAVSTKVRSTSSSVSISF